MIRNLIAFFLLWAHLSAVGQNITVEKPSLPAFRFTLDSIPESQLNVPIQVDLKPFFALANKKVDTLFTSPKYPNEWGSRVAIQGINTVLGAAL